MILRRIPGSRFSEVVPEWKGVPAVLIGGGPSLTMTDVMAVRCAREAGHIRCIAVNDAYLVAEFADILYAADASWHVAHAAGVAKPLLKIGAEQARQKFADFGERKCSIESQVGNITDDRAHILRNARTDPNGRGIHDVGLSLEAGSLITGSHSGWQALNLAALAGANPVLLLGYDARADGNGRTHWHGGHQGAMSGEADWLTYRRSFVGGQNALRAAGIRVINCSPGTAIDTFEKMPLTGALESCLTPAT